MTVEKNLSLEGSGALFLGAAGHSSATLMVKYLKIGGARKGNQGPWGC